MTAPSAVLAILLVGAATLALLHHLRHRRTRERLTQTKRSNRVRRRPVASGEGLISAGAEAVEDPWHQARQQAKLARKLLTEVDEASDASRRRREQFQSLQVRFGFQADSVANQREHLTSLVVAYLARNNSYDEALTRLHTKLLRPVEVWREVLEANEKTRLDGSWHAGSAAGPIVKPTHVASSEGGRAAAEEYAASARSSLVTLQGRHHSWVHMSVPQMEEEISLFLLVWGEAGSLRFCPELLYFLFEVLRASLEANSLEASSDSKYVFPATDWSAATASEHGTTHTARENEFLEAVLKPIFQQMLRERTSDVRARERDKRNYDDFNEAFWSYEHLRRLRSKPQMASGGGSGDGGDSGEHVMSAPPRLRYAILLRADWADFFDAIEKTHCEFRWWSCLLAANRRIFLLHALSFGALAIVGMPALPPGADFNGWGRLRLFPFLLLLPFISSCYGRLFGWWAQPTTRTRALVLNAAAKLLFEALLCVSLVLYQMTESAEEFSMAGLERSEPYAIASVTMIAIFFALFVGAKVGVPTCTACTAFPGLTSAL